MRLRVFMTHPVQYHAPVFRRVAREPGLDVKVFYFNDQSIRGGLDKDFGVRVAWDGNLLDGYEHEFLSRDLSLEKRREMRIESPDALLRRERPDWVFVSGYTYAFERQLISRAHAHGARVTMRGEFSDLSFGERSLPKRIARAAYLRWFYRHVDTFGYIGEDAKRHLLRHGIEPSKLFFSPYCIDDSVVAARRGEQARVEARRSLSFAPDDFAFVVSGKLIPRKDPFLILAALRALPDRGRVKLVVLGDGELKDRFVAEARALLGDNFVFPGFINQAEIGRYLAAADAMILPSRYETWGLVVNEAMHHGLPNIVSDRVGCARDLILPGETGLVFPCGDAAALSACMQTLIERPQLARTMGRAAMRRVEAYSVEAAAQGIIRAIGHVSDDKIAV